MPPKKRVLVNKPRPIRAQLMHYFENHPGVNVFIDDMVQELNEERTRIQAGITNLRNAMPDYPIEVIQVGNVWRYRPGSTKSAKDTHKVFEEIGTTKEGDVILQREDGALFRAKEL